MKPWSLIRADCLLHSEMNIKKKITSILMAGAICVLCSPSLYAMDLALQPRLETGVMYYAIEFGSESKTVPVRQFETSGYNETRQQVEYSDTVGFVGCGATLFIKDRFFIDLSGHYASDGSDITSGSYSEYSERHSDEIPESFYASEAFVYDGQFSRKDHAISLGYAVTRRFSVFVGYKWAEVDLDAAVSGSIQLFSLDDLGTPSDGNWSARGVIVGQEHCSFDYSGPFIGGAHEWSLGRDSGFGGLLSINAGVAHLNSKLERKISGTSSITSLNGAPPPEPISSPYWENREAKGETLGLTLGINWSGLTPLNNLFYSVALSGYRYQFDSNESASPNTNESVLSLKFGLVYLIGK